MKIVLFIDNHSMDNVDISSLPKGNPGIGGTQYEMFLLAYLMFQKQNEIDFQLALTHKQAGFDFQNIFIVNQYTDIFSYCEDNAIDILIMRENKYFDLIHQLTKTKVVFLDS